MGYLLGKQGGGAGNVSVESGLSQPLRFHSMFNCMYIFLKFSCTVNYVCMYVCILVCRSQGTRR